MPIAVALGLVTLLFVPVLGLLVGLAILAAGLVALMALAGAILAAPFLLVRFAHRRWRRRTQITEAPQPTYAG